MEFAPAAAGGIGLALPQWAPFVPVRVLLIVGVHFFALAPILGMPALNLLAALLVASAVAALLVASAVAALLVASAVAALLVASAVAATIVALRSNLQPSFLTGVFSGPILLAFAAIVAAPWPASQGSSEATSAVSDDILPLEAGSALGRG